MPAVASESVQVASDGAAIGAFLVEPVGRAGQAPAVLVLHGWWGLTGHIKDTARRFADAGFVACAPDLYSRVGPGAAPDPADAAQRMGRLSSQAVLRDLNAAVQFLKGQPSVDPLRLGVVGFSMGGTFALTQATHNSDLRAAVAFYGKVPPVESFEYLLCPVLYHHAAQDAWVTAAEVDLLRQARDKLGKPIEVAGYPDADHDFFNEARPQAYRAADAQAAWDRTVRFLAARLQRVPGPG